MWGITIFGLVVVIVAIVVIAAIGAARLGRRSSPSAIRDETERELGVRETTLGEEESPLKRPKTGA
ncbi:MAG TPA: hypothetical protein VGG89_07305 [Candidatus Baltobacteraceae bacterium]|jgi:hypothetical protein